MTVAAVILAADAVDAAAAVRPIEGRAVIRRIAEAAWAGGALPVIVSSADPGGLLAGVLAGAIATLVPPPGPDSDVGGQLRGAIDAARAEVAETDAILLWPVRMAWVDPETLTSLIEAHGVHPDAVLRPAFAGEAGWPVLLPLRTFEGLAERSRATSLDRLLGEVAARAAVRQLDLGDPGATRDLSTPRDALPAYLGPSAPAGGEHHEWGSPAAEIPDDTPVEGPARARPG